MSPFLLVSIVLFVLMAQKLTDIYLRGHYACPSCGARTESRHSPNCPRNVPRSR